MIYKWPWDNDNEETDLAFLLPALLFAYSNLSIPGLWYIIDIFQGDYKMLLIFVFWLMYPWIYLNSFLMMLEAVPAALVVGFNEVLYKVALGQLPKGTSPACTYIYGYLLNLC